ncbi:MAG: cytochrome c biogenesis protein ResB [Syntrophomonadaceae bacterium]|nr:cytochrome c biogenesis protein ResB [Syntrophomonadaceae bacterium]
MQAMHRIFNFISSMKTGLVLLLLIGLAAAAGSSFLPRTFYQIPAFKLLLLLLLLNMSLCTVKRFRQTSRILLSKTGSRVWFRNLGSLLLHLGILLVLIGGIIYSIHGQQERIHLLPGQQVDISRVLNIENPFTLRLEEFRIEFNEDGSTSQYISEVTILEQGKKTGQAAISVNHPLNYQGVKAYQTSFGYRVHAEYTENGEKKSSGFLEGAWLNPDGTDRRVKIYKYIPDFDPERGMNSVTLRPDNPQVIFSVYEDDNVLGIGAAKFNDPVRIDENVYVSFTGVESYTILDVKYDPGLPLALAGGMLLALGICLVVLAAPSPKNLRELKPQP